MLKGKYKIQLALLITVVLAIMCLVAWLCNGTKIAPFAGVINLALAMPSTPLFIHLMQKIKEEQL